MFLKLGTPAPVDRVIDGQDQGANDGKISHESSVNGEGVENQSCGDEEDQQ